MRPIVRVHEGALEPQIADIYHLFGWNNRQIDILAPAHPNRDDYCQPGRGDRFFDPGLGEIALAFTATSSKSDQAAITRILAGHRREGSVPPI